MTEAGSRPSCVVAASRRPICAALTARAFGLALGDAIRRGIIGRRVNVGQSSLAVAPRQPHRLPQTDVQKAA